MSRMPGPARHPIFVVTMASNARQTTSLTRRDPGLITLTEQGKRNAISKLDLGAAVVNSLILLNLYRVEGLALGNIIICGA